MSYRLFMLDYGDSTNSLEYIQLFLSCSQLKRFELNGIENIIRASKQIVPKVLNYSTISSDVPLFRIGHTGLLIQVTAVMFDI